MQFVNKLTMTMVTCSIYFATFFEVVTVTTDIYCENNSKVGGQESIDLCDKKKREKKRSFQLIRIFGFWITQFHFAQKTCPRPQQLAFSYSFFFFYITIINVKSIYLWDVYIKYILVPRMIYF